jgi:hypothetical protein
MDKRIAFQWTAALRSGRYTQGRKALHSFCEESSVHCCLGVLCELYLTQTGEGGWRKVGLTAMEFVPQDGEARCDRLPDSVQAWAGMKSADGGMGDAFDGSLASRNDRGVTFSELADLIDANVENL